jgi:16S rRNA (cytosine967-C5)-methyltransferase
MVSNTPQPRSVAHSILIKVRRDGAWAERALSSAFTRSTLSPRDRSLVTDIVYGTIRHTICIDYHLNRLAKKPLRKLPLTAQCALRLGAYQILYTRIPPHAAVNESVKLVVKSHKHLRAFANGLLRNLSRQKQADSLNVDIDDPLERLAVQSSHPLWLLQSVAEQLGRAQTADWAHANNQVARVCVRLRPCSKGRDNLAQSFSDAGFEVHSDPRFPESLWVKAGCAIETWPGFAEGYFVVQDLAAQMTSKLCAATEGECVLDLCAAPGGKSMHVADSLGPSGKVIALDKHPGKIHLLQKESQRLGLTKIYAQACDSSHTAQVEEIVHTHAPQGIDWVLVDAPCSGLGTLRRNPELKTREEDSLASLVTLQAHLLDTGAHMVMPDKHLVYVVCTMTPAETCGQVEGFLHRHPEFYVVPITASLVQDFVVHEEQGDVFRSWPHRHLADGFFGVVFKRGSLHKDSDAGAP